MTEKVLKPFNTATRKFAPPAEVSPADIDGPVTFEQYQARGFISGAVPVRAATPEKFGGKNKTATE